MLGLILGMLGPMLGPLWGVTRRRVIQASLGRPPSTRLTALNGAWLPREPLAWRRSQAGLGLGAGFAGLAGLQASQLAKED